MRSHAHRKLILCTHAYCLWSDHVGLHVREAQSVSKLFLKTHDVLNNLLLDLWGCGMGCGVRCGRSGERGREGEGSISHCTNLLVSTLIRILGIAVSTLIGILGIVVSTLIRILETQLHCFMFEQIGHCAILVGVNS